MVAKVKTFRHSGHLGDMIYSLASVRQLGGGIFYVDKDRKLPGKMAPLGFEKSSLMIDLIQTQDYIEECKLYGGETINHDLDLFRKVIGVTKEYHLAESHWRGIKQHKKEDIDLGVTWFKIEKRELAPIVISRSTRRTTTTYNWEALKDYGDKCVFLGHTNEWEAFEKRYKIGTKHHRVANLVEFAKIVSGCELFVGNQSFGFSLAEAQKVPRCIEEYKDNENCTPQTSNGHTELTREIIEKYVS